MEKETLKGEITTDTDEFFNQERDDEQLGVKTFEKIKTRQNINL